MADLEERLRITDHNPRWPLGCPVSWGPRLNFGSTSGGLHCCRERHRGHGYQHVCKCGATHKEVNRDADSK